LGSNIPLRTLADASVVELSVQELVDQLLELLAVVCASALEVITPGPVGVALPPEVTREVAVSVHVEFVNHGADELEGPEPDENVEVIGPVNEDVPLSVQVLDDTEIGEDPDVVSVQVDEELCVSWDEQDVLLGFDGTV
jgi:hypothetical protein